MIWFACFCHISQAFGMVSRVHKDGLPNMGIFKRREVIVILGIWFFYQAMHRTRTCWMDLRGRASQLAHGEMKESMASFCVRKDGVVFFGSFFFGEPDWLGLISDQCVLRAAIFWNILKLFAAFVSWDDDQFASPFLKFWWQEKRCLECHYGLGDHP